MRAKIAHASCFQLHLATPSQEFNREEAEKQRRMMEGSPPTPRSLRLAQLSASQEELRRSVWKLFCRTKSSIWLDNKSTVACLIFSADTLDIQASFDSRKCTRRAFVLHHYCPNPTETPHVGSLFPMIRQRTNIYVRCCIVIVSTRGAKREASLNRTERVRERERESQAQREDLMMILYRRTPVSVTSPAGTLTPAGGSIASSLCGSEGGLTPTAVSPGGDGGFLPSSPSGEGGFLPNRATPAVIHDHIRCQRDRLHEQNSTNEKLHIYI